MRHAFPGSGGQFRGRELTLEAVGRTFCPDPRPGTRRPLRIYHHSCFTVVYSSGISYSRS